MTSDAELGQPSATVQAAGGLAPVAVHAVVGIGAFAPGAPLPFDADAHLEAPAVEPAGAGILVVVDALVVADAAVRILPRAIDQRSVRNPRPLRPQVCVRAPSSTHSSGSSHVPSSNAPSTHVCG